MKRIFKKAAALRSYIFSILLASVSALSIIFCYREYAVNMYNLNIQQKNEMQIKGIISDINNKISNINSKLYIKQNLFNKNQSDLALLAVSGTLKSVQVHLSEIADRAFVCSDFSRLNATECLLSLPSQRRMIQQSAIYSQSDTPLVSTEPLDINVKTTMALATYRALRPASRAALISSRGEIFYIERKESEKWNSVRYFVALLSPKYFGFDDKAICSHVKSGSITLIFPGDNRRISIDCGAPAGDINSLRKGDFDTVLGVHLITLIGDLRDEPFATLRPISFDRTGKGKYFIIPQISILFGIVFLMGCLILYSRRDSRSYVDMDNLKIIMHELMNDIISLKSLGNMLHVSQQDGRSEKILKALRLNCDSIISYFDGVIRSLTSGNKQISISNINSNIFEIIMDIVEVYKLQAENKGLDFVSSINLNDINSWYCDPILIRHVLSNILGNAIKYTDKGIISISVSIKDCNDKHRLLISVEDTGCGIESQSNIDIFAPFVRGKNISQNVAGFGVGLHICQIAADLMNGSIYFEPGQKGGTKFVFEGDIEPAVVSRVLRQDGHTVVLAGLSPSHNTYLMDLLKSNDVKVDTSDDSFTTIAVCERVLFHWKKLDLVLLDGDIEGESIEVTVEKCLASCGDKLSTIAVIGADLSALSTPGTSIVRLEYPLDEQCIFNLLNQPLRAVETERKDKKIRVMLIEDNPVNTFFLKSGLESRDCSVFTAASGEEGLLLLQKESFDCALVDLRLPGISGFEVAKCIRTARCGTLPIIIGITAHLLEDVSSECRKAGMNGVVSKRSDLADTVSLMRSELARASGCTVLNTQMSLHSHSSGDLISEIDEIKFDFHKLQSCWSRMGNVAVRELIAEISADMPRLFDEMKTAISSGEFLKASDLAHRFTGIFYQLGGIDLHDQLLAFEDSCRDSDSEAAQKLINESELSWQYVSRILTRFLKETVTKNAA